MRGILRQVTITTAMLAAFAGLAPRAEAALVQIGSFQSASGLYSYVAGSLTGSTSGDFTFDPAFAAIFGLPTSTYAGSTLQVSATATGSVTSSSTPTGTTLFQAMNGFISVHDSANTLLVRTDFTNAFLQGVVGTNSVTLGGSSAFGTVVYSSNTFNQNLVGPPSDFAFDLNPTNRPVAQSGSNYANFTAPDIANFSTTVQTPEPASLALFGLGLTAVGALARRRRRK